MTPPEYMAAAQAATVAGLASLFLPGVDKAWSAAPSDEFVGHQIDSGTVMYLTVALGVGTLYSLASGTVLPLVVAAAVSGFVVAHHRRAFASVELPPGP